MCLAPKPHPWGQELFIGTPKARQGEPETPSYTPYNRPLAVFFLPLHGRIAAPLQRASDAGRQDAGFHGLIDFSSLKGCCSTPVPRFLHRRSREISSRQAAPDFGGRKSLLQRIWTHFTPATLGRCSEHLSQAFMLNLKSEKNPTNLDEILPAGQVRQGL